MVNIQQVISALMGLCIVLLGYFGDRVLNKMDDIHDDIKTLTIAHGERLTRVETELKLKRGK